MQQIERNLKSGAYMMVVTENQLHRFKDFNSRSKPEDQQAFGGNCDGIEIVPNDHPRADMICGRWFGMTIGILPDGTAHS
jgi:hypothetical protein